ncbi:MAG: bifunctional ornithine acetyltransferase/N-acetylglutamate synthase, partial [Gammaproteobacteria bacterium]|nr:bifunctional ornithine acetyltransferase/N-acetylglutamate synthase [Gammaproteobacteria bacterium]
MSEFPKVSGLFPVEGIRVGTTCAGIKKTDRRDLVVFEIAEGASTAAVFTNNAFCAAPVIVAKQHRATHSPRYLLINTGNANAGTGEQGIKDAFSCCKTLSAEVNCKTEQVLPFSTGVIAEPIPVDKIQTAIPKAIEQLDENGWGDAAYGILTTDLVPKSCS